MYKSILTFKLFTGLLMSLLLVSCVQTEERVLYNIDKYFYEGQYSTVNQIIDKEMNKDIYKERTDEFKQNLMKYQTMLLCMKDKPQACYQSFVKIFSVYNNFRLSKMEAEHPKLKSSYYKALAKSKPKSNKAKSKKK